MVGLAAWVENYIRHVFFPLPFHSNQTMENYILHFLDFPFLICHHLPFQPNQT